MQDTLLPAAEMAEFPQLEVLAKAAQLSSAPRPFAGMILVGVQHLLETTGSLVEMLMTLGLEPDDIFLTGKVYSTCADVRARLQALGVKVFWSRSLPELGTLEDQITSDVVAMWQAVERRLQQTGRRRVVPSAVLMLDDGAFSVRNIPEEISSRFPVVGVEQTTWGTREGVRVGHVHVPVIDVATSAAKVLLEPALIQRAVIERLRKVVDLDNPSIRFGVVGLGNIGKAVSTYLGTLGTTLSVFDIDEYAQRRCGLPESSWCSSLREVVHRSDCVLGCTGSDLFAGADWVDAIEGEKVLASCSSHDAEFRTLLRRAGSRPDPLSTVRLRLPGGTIRILRGGTPINFDNTGESVPASDIALTRGLLLAGLLQAAQWACAPRFRSLESIKLAPGSQRVVAQEWLQVSGRRSIYPASTLRVFDSEHDIATGSGGTLDTPLAKGRKSPARLALA